MRQLHTPRRTVADDKRAHAPSEMLKAAEESDDDDDDDDEDDEEELMRELERIKQERAQEALKRARRLPSAPARIHPLPHAPPHAPLLSSTRARRLHGPWLTCAAAMRAGARGGRERAQGAGQRHPAGQPAARPDARGQQQRRRQLCREAPVG